MKQKNEIITLILCEMNSGDGSTRAVQTDENLKEYQNSKVLHCVKLFRRFGEQGRSKRGDKKRIDLRLSEINEEDFILVDKS